MLNQLSPGVNFSEIDKTTRAPSVSTAVGAFVGNFRWGPVEEITTVVSEPDLASKFGSPTPSESIDFHVATQFLSYSRNLRLVRVVTSAAVNANTGGDTDILVKSRDHYDGLTFTFADEGSWVAKYPGAIGNSLQVSVFAFNTDASTTETNFGSWAYAGFFEGPVGTSDWAAARGSSNDEIHVAVIDQDGLFTGTPGTVLETFPYLSQASDAKDATGASTYFKTVINERSEYIWFGAKDSTNFSNLSASAAGGLDFATSESSGVVTESLSAGADSGTLTSSEFDTGYALFADPAASDVSILIGPNYPSSGDTTVANDIIGICEARKDCVCTLSPAASDTTVANIVDFFNSLTRSSYAIFDSGRLRVYDKYNDTYVNIPASGSVAGLLAETDRTKGSWYSPAGFSRGQIRNVFKLALNPNQTERDTLYKAGVNPIVTFQGQGTVLFGDKTGLARPSAFDRINVRRLFITLEKSITIAARDVLFEMNNEFTRGQFINIVEPLLRNIQGRQGINQFAVVCDETNNPGDVVDRNEFVADIYIQPSRSVNFIQLNFIATRTGASFNTIVGN